jgi:hypothetical protein
MLFHHKSMHSFLVKNLGKLQIILKKTTHLQYMAQAHQTRQWPYTASNISESYWILPMPSPMLWRHHARHPLCRNTGNFRSSACKSTPTWRLFVAMLRYLPFSQCTLPASAAIAPPTAKARPWSNPHCERSLFEETQKVRSRFVFVCFCPTPSTLSEFYNPVHTNISSPCPYQIAL